MHEINNDPFIIGIINMGKKTENIKSLFRRFCELVYYKVCEISLEKIDAVLSLDDLYCKLVCVVHNGFLYFMPLLHT